MNDTIHIHIERETPVRVITVEPTGGRGAQGIQGIAGPNSVTSATTSDGTANLSVATITGDGSGLTGLVSAQITDASTSPVYDEATELYKEVAALYNEDGQLNAAEFITQPNGVFYALGANSDDFASISATSSPLSFRFNGRDYRFNAPSTGDGVQWDLPNLTGTLALTSSATGIPDKLTNGTIAGTLTVNSTSYTYGSGAAAAHRDALGLGTLATQNGTFSDKANIAGGNSFTGVQSIATTGATAALALSTTSTSSAIVLETALAASATGTTSIAIGRALTTNNAAIFGHGASYAYAHVQGRTAADFNVQSSGNVCIGTVTDNNSFGGAKLQVRGQGSSTANWRGRIVAGGDNTVFLMGEYNSGAWLGAHNGALSAWADMYIQAQGGKDLCVAYDGSSFYPNSRIITGATLAMGTASPNASALIDMTSTTKGFLPPRVTTTQRNAISSPAAGLMVYNTTTNKINFYNGSAWEAVTSA